MSNTNNKQTEKVQEMFVQDFLDNMEEYPENIFYEEISEEENGIALDIYKTIQTKEIIVENDLIEIFKNRNSYILIRDETIKNDLRELIRIINRTYKTVQINIAKEQERKRQKDSVSKGLKDISNIITECAKDITEEKENKYSKKEKEIKILFESKNIPIADVKIKQTINEKYIIELILKNETYIEHNSSETHHVRTAEKKDRDLITHISDILSRNIGTKISFLKDRGDSQVYSSEDKYVIQVGSSKIAKEQSEVSRRLRFTNETGRWEIHTCNK